MIIALSGSTLPTIFKRRYMHLDKDAHTQVYGVLFSSDDGGGYDVMNELVFEHREAYGMWIERVGVDSVGKDEEMFLDGGMMTGWVVVDAFETVKAKE
jgi:hypothetical protein